MSFFIGLFRAKAYWFKMDHRIWAKGSISNNPSSDGTKTFFSIVSSPPDYIALMHHLLPVERSAGTMTNSRIKESEKTWLEIITANYKHITGTIQLRTNLIFHSFQVSILGTQDCKKLENGLLDSFWVLLKPLLSKSVHSAAVCNAIF